MLAPEDERRLSNALGRLKLITLARGELASEGLEVALHVQRPEVAFFDLRREIRRVVNGGEKNAPAHSM